MAPWHILQNVVEHRQGGERRVRSISGIGARTMRPRPSLQACNGQRDTRRPHPVSLSYTPHARIIVNRVQPG